MSVEININKAVKKYGNLTIIPGLDEHIKNGEFFTLLGPSGCGKTTLLRMIAGFNSIEGGTIAFNDKVINDIPAHERNIGMVFQSYAIFPHLTVHPSVLLMDEPLSNLDAKLRVEMRTAIREIQKQVGITTVYVTHDQEEALSISDRIAVMKKGEIQQTARPHTIYTRPYNVFVSTFIGHSNLFHGTIKGDANGKVVVFNDGYIMPMDNLSEDAVDGMEVIISVRPEEFSIQKDGLKCKIKNKVFLGKYNTYFLEFPENMLIPDQPSIEFSQDLGHAERLLDIDEEVVLRPNPAKVNIFTADGSRNLLKGVVLHE